MYVDVCVRVHAILVNFVLIMLNLDHDSNAFQVAFSFSDMSLGNHSFCLHPLCGWYFYFSSFTFSYLLKILYLSIISFFDNLSSLSLIIRG